MRSRAWVSKNRRMTMLGWGLSTARRVLSGCAVAAALIVAPTAASAASYTFNLSGNVGDGSFNSFTAGGVDYQTYELVLPLATSFVLASGDDVTVNISLNVPLNVPGGDQFFGVNMHNVADPANATTSGTITFSGLTGGPITNPQIGNCSNCLSNIIFTSGLAYQFLGLGSFAIHLFDGDPITVGAFSISYQVSNPSEVPLPAALPLFATVLAGGGLVAWRRKRKGVVAAAD